MANGAKEIAYVERAEQAFDYFAAGNDTKRNQRTVLLLLTGMVQPGKYCHLQLFQSSSFHSPGDDAL